MNNAFRNPVFVAFMLFILVSFFCGCNRRSVNPTGNRGSAIDYGGTETAMTAVRGAQDTLKLVFARLQAGRDAGALCEDVCAAGEDLQICMHLNHATSQQRATAKQLITESLADGSAVLNRAAEDLISVSETPLALEGRRVSAMTPLGPSGQISFFRDDVLNSAPDLLIAILGHEVYHKVPSRFTSAGSFLADSVAVPPQFPEANGGWQLATLSGMCLAAYADAFLIHKLSSPQLFVLTPSTLRATTGTLSNGNAPGSAFPLTISR